MRQFSAEKYTSLFDKYCALSPLEQWAAVNQGVLRYRTKIIKSGKMLEVEIFPIWETKNEVRKAKKYITQEQMAKKNDKNARKHLCRVANTNFTCNDITITLDYAIEPSVEQAKKDITNFIRRIKSYRRRHRLPEIKYIYTTAGGTPKKDGTLTRIHHHVIMSGMDRDEAERIWTKGKYPHCRRLKFDDNGITGLATYFERQHQADGLRRWNGSKNLAEPRITTNNHKISKRKAEKMAADLEDAPREIFSKLFPDYEFNNCEVHQSEFVAGFYIYSIMHKRSSQHENQQQAGSAARNRRGSSKLLSGN